MGEHRVSAVSAAPGAAPYPEPTTDRRPTQQPLTIAVRNLGPIRRHFALHPRLSDALVIAAFVLPLLVSVVMGPVNPSSPLSGGAGVAVLVGGVGTVAVAMWWRRTRPWTVLLIALGWGVVSAFSALDGGAQIACALCVYAVAAARGPRHGWTGFAVVTAVFSALTYLISTDELLVTPEGFEITEEQSGEVVPVGTTDLRLGVAIGSALLWLAALTIGNSVFSRRQHEAGLVDRLNQLALERDQREQLAVADERTRIARELHDVVAHSLTVMITLAEGSAGVAPRDPERAAAVMLDVAETGRVALTEMRTVVDVLRTSGDDPTGTFALRPAPTGGLDELVEQFRTAGLPVTFTRSGPDLPDDVALRLAVYRIAQEALTNVLRYAPRARKIDVRLARTPQTVELSIANSPGPGTHPPAPGTGRGLIGMRERVAVFGGTLTAGPSGHHDSSGWRVAATLPLRHSPAALTEGDEP